jgi:hypothetical protein
MTADEAVVSGLRAWGRGVYATEAAVELLVRSFGGRFASAGQPWIRHRPGGYWLDTGALAELSSGVSGGERRVLAVVQALASEGPLADLPGVLAGVDREHLRLMLAAFSHAAGSHQYSLMRRGGQAGFYRPGPIVSWPDQAGDVER